MKRYVLFLAYEPVDFAAMDEAVQRGYHDDHHAFDSFVERHGRLLGSAALADADTATTVRRGPSGAVQVTDGPWAETVEMVGGYYDVELPDLDTALRAAALLPATYTVEVRPTVVIEGYDRG
ncbi:YciI family protein [Auraticoccus monumenti]|uniref:Uncharacterized conserved protein n=1 Tax=Auraticoccus monumenti TaxID=675864 RepID=A0A1G6YDL0_9ACTN|nr:YciI family protein [Auraticoccus monumenti]SDD88458.1 Uncharacterized conserved protein [Auraticoccus monumenti]